MNFYSRKRIIQEIIDIPQGYSETGGGAPAEGGCPKKVKNAIFQMLWYFNHEPSMPKGATY